MVCQAQEGGWGALCSVGMGPGAPVAGRGLLGGGCSPLPQQLCLEGTWECISRAGFQIPGGPPEGRGAGASQHRSFLLSWPSWGCARETP